MAILTFSRANSQAIYFGLSSDTKPTANAGNLFFETDTGKIFFVSAGSWAQSQLPSIAVVDGGVLSTGTGTGMTLASSTSEKWGAHGVTPTAQRAGSAQAAVATDAATNVLPFGYTSAAQANGIVTLLNEIRAVLVEKGLMKGSA